LGEGERGLDEEVLGERTGNRVDLIDEHFVVAAEEVDARHAANRRDVADHRRIAPNGVGLGLWHHGRQFARRRHHSLAPDVLVAVVEDLGALVQTKGAFDRREGQRGIGAYGDLNVCQVRTIRLHDTAEGQVRIRREARSRRREVRYDVDADR